MRIDQFPIVNATLNGTSAVLLAIGYILIRNNKWRAHATVMILALISSATFLGFYLTYHYLRLQRGIAVTKFPNIPQIQGIYYAILISHIILAFTILPLAGITVYLAARRRWPKHKRMGKIALPVWFYVSVTGVIIYWMLYRLAPSLMAWRYGR